MDNNTKTSIKTKGGHTSATETQAQALVILCSCPDMETAKKIAHTLVETKLAACVNILPQVTSVYTWQGKIENATEVLLLIKTTASVYPMLEASLSKLHPYDCPEIIGLPIEHGMKGYLQWIQDSVLINP